MVHDIGVVVAATVQEPVPDAGAGLTTAVYEVVAAPPVTRPPSAVHAIATDPVAPDLDSVTDDRVGAAGTFATGVNEAVLEAVVPDAFVALTVNA